MAALMIQIRTYKAGAYTPQYERQRRMEARGKISDSKGLKEEDSQSISRISIEEE